MTVALERLPEDLRHHIFVLYRLRLRFRMAWRRRCRANHRRVCAELVDLYLFANGDAMIACNILKSSPSP